MHITGSRNGCVAEAPAAGMAAPYRSVEQYAELDLTLFVACYNEEPNIAGTLDAIQEAMKDLPLTYEIIVVDDASRDGSVEVVKEYQRRNSSVPLTLVENPTNRGLAHNFAEAAFLGRGRYYKLVCGDNVDSRETLINILQHLGTADLLVPYHERCEGRTRFRLFLSRSYTGLVNLLSGYSLVYYNGCGVFRRADVMRWHSRTSGFGFQAELVISLLDKGASYLQVPIVGRERQAGSSSALKLRNWLSVG
ncbi:MAG TPA: glycosyltransferase family 2 protein, partial [Gemmataceae bacterium]|nr:glycosyltransferase family 2 protein [Gemmataceae bacterium]